MPREDRRIIFDMEEAYKAIYALCVQRERRKPPPGKISQIKGDPDDADIIYVTVENPQESSKEEIQYSMDFVAAALMVFCRGSGIPLPKGAAKTVEFAKDHVILRVQI